MGFGPVSSSLCILASLPRPSHSHPGLQSFPIFGRLTHLHLQPRPSCSIAHLVVSFRLLSISKTTLLTVWPGWPFRGSLLSEWYLHRYTSQKPHTSTGTLHDQGSSVFHSKHLCRLPISLFPSPSPSHHPFSPGTLQWPSNLSLHGYSSSVLPHSTLSAHSIHKFYIDL